MTAEAPPSHRAGGRPRHWRIPAVLVVVAWATLLGLSIGVGRFITGPLRSLVAPPDEDLARWFAGDARHRSTPWPSTQLLGDTITVVVLGPLVALAAFSGGETCAWPSSS